MMISPGFFFQFFGQVSRVKGQKIAQNDKNKTITSVTCHISGTVHHMIIIFGTLV